MVGLKLRGGLGVKAARAFSESQEVKRHNLVDKGSEGKNRVVVTLLKSVS